MGSMSSRTKIALATDPFLAVVILAERATANATTNVSISTPPSIAKRLSGLPKWLLGRLTFFAGMTVDNNGAIYLGGKGYVLA
jgi:hypothetical protein